MKSYLCLELCPWAGNDDNKLRSDRLVVLKNITCSPGSEDVLGGLHPAPFSAETSRLEEAELLGRRGSRRAAEATLEST